ncbi:unnamed protein product [Ostreobium quekettii]|uniref:EGF-like domain-containing protein n=1 Tax=Ostreobium quekettii TaxID=121088 RepID=A0A8S1INF7_9CHLO|nr:unnamed protein product [Ostreobium quekettii]
MGFDGPDCQLDVREESMCPTGVLDVEGNCCETAVYDHFTGQCCKGEGVQLDKSGRCCLGTLDVCGECNGTAIFIDALGRCCDSTLDSSGLCCSSGDVDVCGVCDGFGASCGTQVIAIVQTDTIEEDRVEQCVAQGIAELLELEEGNDPTVDILWTDGGADSLDIAFNISGIPRSKLGILGRLAMTVTNSTARGDGCTVMDILSVERLPVCGNGVCEVGEAAGSSGSSSRRGFGCPEDCPFRFDYNCPTANENSLVGRQDEMCSGNGRCLYAEEGRCDCYAGYEGAACDRCSLGFMVFNRKCVLRTGAATPPGGMPFCCTPGQQTEAPAEGPRLEEVDGAPTVSVVDGSSSANGNVEAIPRRISDDISTGDDSQFGVSEAAFTSIMAVAIIVFIMCISLALLSYKRRARRPGESVTEERTTGESGPVSDRDSKTYAAIWQDFRQGLTRTDGGARSLPMIMSSSEPRERGTSIIGMSSPPLKRYSEAGTSTARSTQGISCDWGSDTSDASNHRCHKASCVSSMSSVAEELTFGRTVDFAEMRSQSTSSEKGVSVGNLLHTKQHALKETSSVNIIDQRNQFNPREVSEDPILLTGAAQQQRGMYEIEPWGSTARSSQMNMGFAGSKFHGTEPSIVGPGTYSSMEGGPLGAEISMQSTAANNSRGVSGGQSPTFDWANLQDEPVSQSSDRVIAPAMVSSPWTHMAGRNVSSGKLRMAPPSGMAEDAIYSVRTKATTEDPGLVAVAFQNPVVSSPQLLASRDSDMMPMGCIPSGGEHRSQPETARKHWRGLAAGIIDTAEDVEATRGRPEVRGPRNVGPGENVKFPQYVSIRSHEVDMELSDWEKEMCTQNVYRQAPGTGDWESASHDSMSYGERESQRGDDSHCHPLQLRNVPWTAASSLLPEELRPNAESVFACEPENGGNTGTVGTRTAEVPENRQRGGAPVLATHDFRLSDVSRSTTQSSAWQGEGGDEKMPFENASLPIDDGTQMASSTSESWDDEGMVRKEGFGGHPTLARKAAQGPGSSSLHESRQPGALKYNDGLAPASRTASEGLEYVFDGEGFSPYPTAVLDSGGSMGASWAASPLEACHLNGRNGFESHPLQWE